MRTKEELVGAISTIEEKFFSFQNTLRILVNEDHHCLYAFDSDGKELDELVEAVLCAVKVCSHK